jgi:outer membrane receptor for ferric coprogen and ferric-rhodotorulic acid
MRVIRIHEKAGSSMSSKLRNAVRAAGWLAGAFSTAVGAQSGDELETILISSQREARVSSGATGLDLDIKDTPQSISVVTAEQMDVFGADSINDALRLATGINVEEWETNRTNYMARGFEIKNTQIDGIGLPNDWGIVTGAFDSFGYEKLEVIRGANGLLTGVGNASGTINYVRKRPTNDRRGSVELSGGSWGLKRVEADYSTPLVENGAWAARVAIAAEDKDSYLRGLANDRVFFYGVIDGQLSDRSTLAVGYSYQDADTTGNMWGALVLSNTDGTQAEFDPSVSTTQDWTYWNTRQHTAFAELTYALPHDWQAKLTYNYRKNSEDDELFFAFSETGLDPLTGEGLVGWPGKWLGNGHAHLADLTLSGKYELFGRQHEATLGVSQSASAAELYGFPASPDDPAYGPLPAFPYAGNVVAEPVWGAKALDNTMNQRLRRFYGATRIEVLPRLKAVLGFNLAEYHRDGANFGGPFDQTETELSPYAGLTYNFTDSLLAYASYSDIYQPQDQYDINEVYLAPSKGVNYEIGVKAEWLDRRLLTTVALFKAEQQGLSTFAGINGNGNYYYEGVDVESQGVELELVGRLNEYANLTFGFTALTLEDQQGDDIYDWVPRRTANLALSSRLPAFTAVTLGVNARWQSDIFTVDGYTGGTVTQGSYATVSAFGRWDITQQLTLRANANNLTDEKYIGSLYQVGFYGTPRNYALSLAYRF